MNLIGVNMDRFSYNENPTEKQLELIGTIKKAFAVFDINMDTCSNSTVELRAVGVRQLYKNLAVAIISCGGTEINVDKSLTELQKAQMIDLEALYNGVAHSNTKEKFFANKYAIRSIATMEV